MPSAASESAASGAGTEASGARRAGSQTSAQPTSAISHARVAQAKRAPRPRSGASAAAASRPHAAHPPPAGPVEKRSTSPRSRSGRNAKPSAAESLPAPNRLTDHGNSSTTAITPATTVATSMRTLIRKPPTSGAASMIAPAAATGTSGASGYHAVVNASSAPNPNNAVVARRRCGAPRARSAYRSASTTRNGPSANTTSGPRRPLAIAFRGTGLIAYASAATTAAPGVCVTWRVSRYAPSPPIGNARTTISVRASPSAPNKAVLRPAITTSPGGAAVDEPSPVYRQPEAYVDRKSMIPGQRANVPTAGTPPVMSRRDPMIHTSATTAASANSGWRAPTDAALTADRLASASERTRSSVATCWATKP